MLTKKRIRRNSKRSKKFLLVGGAVDKDVVIKDMKKRLNIFKECDDECTNLATTIYKDFIKERVEIDCGGFEMDDTIISPEQLEAQLISDEFEKRSRNHIITYVDTHGAINNKIDPKTVPGNTIICFLAPINETNLVFSTNAPNQYINKYMAKLNGEQFKTIINEKHNLSNLDSNLEDSVKYNNIYYEGFNCFKNSIWYYPGDKYPDVFISVSANDVKYDIQDRLYSDMGESKKNTLTFQPYDIEYTKRGFGSNITYTKNNSFYNILCGKKINKGEEDSVRNLLLRGLKIHKSKYIGTLTEKIHLMKNLHIYHNSLGSVIKSLVSDKTRIIITTCCRNFNSNNYEKNKKFLERELFYYHLNKNKYHIIPYPNAQKIMGGKKGEIPLCASEKYQFYTEEKLSIIKLVTMNNNNSYGGKIPELLKLMDKSDLNDSDYRYLSTFSLHKISLFINVKSKGDKDKFTNLWKGVIRQTYKTKELNSKIVALGSFFSNKILTNFTNKNINITNIPIMECLKKIIEDIIPIWEQISAFSPLNPKIITNLKEIFGSSPKIIHEYLMGPKEDDSITNLIIWKNFSISDINGYKKVHTLTANTDLGEYNITIDNNYTNDTVKEIYIYHSLFDLSEKCFQNFIMLNGLYIKLDANRNEPIYISNNNIKEVKIENSAIYNIMSFTLNTPQLNNLVFSNVNFKKGYSFQTLFTTNLNKFKHLKKLSFTDCSSNKFIDSIFFDFLEETQELKILEFINCDFKINNEDKEDILKIIVKYVNKDIEYIHLNFDKVGFNVLPEDEEFGFNEKVAKERTEFFKKFSISEEKKQMFIDLNDTNKFGVDTDI